MWGVVMRKSVAFLVVPLMALGLALLPTGSRFAGADRALAAGAIAGDLNCDGEVTAVDAASTLQVLSGLAQACAPAMADVNCSGGLDVNDAVMLRRYVAGLPVSGPDGCLPIGSAFELTGPSSTARIEEALLAGDITKGQALLYHIYSELDASRLPSEFHGPADEHAHLESSIFHEAATIWSTLSQQEKDALLPFLLPPSDPDSWFSEESTSLRAGVEWTNLGNDRIKVWWQTHRPEDAAKAAAILQELDTYIWPDLVSYMGGAQRAPLSDAGQKGDGGDGRYDVYLVHNTPSEPGEKPVLGWVSPTVDAKGDMKCEVTPTYMVLNSRAALSDVFFSTVAHEFMHSVQFTYDVGNCYDYRWLMESTATWVESWLYPEVNQEHGFAAKYLEQLDTKPLEHWEYKDSRQYGSYLLWFYAHQNEGLYYAVRDAWTASSNPDSLAAVDAALTGAGGLKDAWPESALYNWNRPPYEDFTSQDDLYSAAKWVDTDVTATVSPSSYAVPTDVGHMQQRHLNYTISSDVKRLTFINPFPANFDPAAKVQAILNINGTWQDAVDWTNEDRVSFCFDKPNEKVDQLVIIITNSNSTDRSHVLDAGPAELVATSNGCKGWVGSATATIPHYDTVFHITVENLRFAPDEENPGNERYDFYELVDAGDATWTVSGMWFDGCTPSGTMPLLPPKTDPTAIGGFFHVDKINNTYNVSVHGNTYEDTLIITCPNGDSWEHAWPVSSVLWDGATFKPIPEGNIISDEFIEDKPAYGGHWQWNFRLVE